MGKTILLVGAGRFGAHYVRILSGMNHNPPSGVPFIERLVVTRTRPETARKLAEEVRNDPGCSVAEVVGVAVAESRQLAAVAERYDPYLTCITATDPESGDAIHEVYSRTVLSRGRGRLLCEKPLCPASGDGVSLEAVRRLMRTGKAGRFGLELPMSVVRQKMERHSHFAKRLASAERFGFLWSTTAPLRSDLANALALHPWSLIPERLIPARIEGRDGGDRFDIAGRLIDPRNGRLADLRIELCTDTDDRVMEIDGVRYEIASKGPQVVLRCRDEPLLTVENPLRQNIAASLAGRPTDGMARAASSQAFLERIKGWRTPGAAEDPPPSPR